MSVAQPHQQTLKQMSWRNPHNPFPASLSSECKKAAEIIESFLNPKLALIICTVFRVGFLGSIRFGSGVIVARLPDGNWSAPSAVALSGVGGGGQFGMELTDFVFVLSTDAAVATLVDFGTLTLGANISMALGPGRCAEAGTLLSRRGMAGLYTYSKTGGVYGGVTLEVGVLVERSSANRKTYARKLKMKQLLGGEVPPPLEAESLMRALNLGCLRPRSSIEASGEAEVPSSSQDMDSREPQHDNAGQQHIAFELDAQPMGEELEIDMPQEPSRQSDIRGTSPEVHTQQSSREPDTQDASHKLSSVNFQEPHADTAPRFVGETPQELSTSDHREEAYELAASATRETHLGVASSGAP